MADLLFIEEDDVLSKPGVSRTFYDPAAGTGGMLSVAGEYLEKLGASVVMVGQELNDESYAICKTDMLIKGQDLRAGQQWNSDWPERPVCAGEICEAIHGGKTSFSNCFHSRIQVMSGRLTTTISADTRLEAEPTLIY